MCKDLQTITMWAYQWKMIFNPDITKQAIEVIFSCKKQKPDHPELNFNGIPVAREPFTKHLRVYLDSRLNFSKHIKEQVLKAMKGVSSLKCLSKYVNQNVLDISYKMYVRPHLDYGDVIFHNQRKDLMYLIERVQYKAALIVSGCWQGTSRERLYEELGWESLSDRRWARRLTIFYKINNGLAPSYLSNHIPQRHEISVNLRNRADSTPFIRPERNENSFYPYAIKRWNELGEDSKFKPSVQSFKKHLYDFVRPFGHSLFGIHDQYGIKLLTKIRVSFSNLREHRFNHNFNCDNPLCSCGIEDETSVHFFIRCPHYITLRSILLSKISNLF